MGVWFLYISVEHIYLLSHSLTIRYITYILILEPLLEYNGKLRPSMHALSAVQKIQKNMHTRRGRWVCSRSQDEDHKNQYQDKCDNGYDR